MKREIHVAVNKELPLDHAPFDFSLLPVFKGQRSFFTRDKSGAVKEVDRAGQVFSRVSTISE